MQLAYLDPGSGSIIASALVGGAAAVGVAARSARARLGGALRRKKAGDDQPAPELSDDREDATVDADA